MIFEASISPNLPLFSLPTEVFDGSATLLVQALKNESFSVELSMLLNLVRMATSCCSCKLS